MVKTSGNDKRRNIHGAAASGVGVNQRESGWRGISMAAGYGVSKRIGAR